MKAQIVQGDENRPLLRLFAETPREGFDLAVLLGEVERVGGAAERREDPQGRAVEHVVVSFALARRPGRTPAAKDGLAVPVAAPLRRGRRKARRGRRGGA